MNKILLFGEQSVITKKEFFYEDLTYDINFYMHNFYAA